MLALNLGYLHSFFFFSPVFALYMLRVRFRRFATPEHSSRSATKEYLATPLTNSRHESNEGESEIASTGNTGYSERRREKRRETSERRRTEKWEHAAKEKKRLAFQTVQ